MTASLCQVTFHGLRHSPALDRLVREKSDWLGQFVGNPCEVRALIDAPHRHRHEHALRVHLQVSIPAVEPVTIDREGVGDVYALVRDTFDIARRRLQDVVREQRGFVKTHSDDAGRVV